MDNITISGKTLMKAPFLVRTAGFINGEKKEHKNHSSYSTKQNDATIRVFLSGKGRCVGKTADFSLTPDTVVMTLPEDDSVMMSDKAAPYTHYYCRFTGNYALYVAREIVKRYGSCYFKFSDIRSVAGLMKRMEPISSKRYRRELPKEMGQNEVLLMQLLVLLNNTKEGETYSVKLDQYSLENYLNEHISEPTDLAEIAAYFNVSKTTLVRNTRKLHGLSLLQLHEKIKMEWATKLLSLPSVKISEVAIKTGYHDPLYFSRVFKKRHGCSPREWRRGLFRTTDG